MSTSVATAMDVLAEATTISWIPEHLLWLLIVGFIAAFVLSFSVGANDVANSFGTAVGSKVLTLRQACILGTVFETAGAILLGAKVGEMIRKGIIDVAVYQTEDGVELLMMGEVAAMIGSGLWQLIATVLKVPVSGTHSIVGACIGFSLVAVGPQGVTWSNLGLIVASWFISPVLAGIMAVGLFFFIQKFILDTRFSEATSHLKQISPANCLQTRNRIPATANHVFLAMIQRLQKNPLDAGLKMLPVFYAVTIGVNIVSILYSGAPLLGFDDLPVWGTLLISVAAMVVVAIVVQCYAVPRVRARAEQSEKEDLESNENEDVESASGSTCKKSSISSGFLPPSSQWEGPFTQQSFENVPSTIEEQRKLVRFNTTRSQDESNNELVGESSTSFAVQLTSSDSSNSFNQFEMYDITYDAPEKAINVSTECKKEDPKSKLQLDDEEDDPPVARHLFSTIQILTACFSSFAHGGNDVSNAIGPLIALWIVFWSGSVVQKAFTPWYLLLYGGIGISIGLWILGRRVMETIGNDLTKITPSRGFCVELMTAITVLLASNLGIPVSTTHCKVGAVVSIGWFRSRSAVHWSVVRNIAFAWFVTVPVAGLLSAGAMYLLMQFQ